MDIGSGYALTLMIKATEEYMVFYSQEEFDEYIREHNLSEEDYIDGFIHYELPPEPFLEEANNLNEKRNKYVYTLPYCLD